MAALPWVLLLLGLELGRGYPAALLLAAAKTENRKPKTENRKPAVCCVRWLLLLSALLRTVAGGLSRRASRLSDLGLGLLLHHVRSC